MYTPIKILEIEIKTVRRIRNKTRTVSTVSVAPILHLLSLRFFLAGWFMALIKHIHLIWFFNFRDAVLFLYEKVWISYFLCGDKIVFLVGKIIFSFWKKDVYIFFEWFCEGTVNVYCCFLLEIFTQTPPFSKHFV